MNILIISENYTRGGLETHIATYYEELKKNNKVFFAFGNYEDFGLLSDSNIELGFHFNCDVTIGDFMDDVNRLVKLVEDKKIDVIHVHPFFSLFQAIFVAQITKTKLVYTYHGPASLTFTTSLFDEIMMEYALETTVSSIFSVSQRGVDGFGKIFSKEISLLPNPIDVEMYRKTEIKFNKKWALVSRLDEDKKDVIKKFIDYLDKLDINELDVWGDGTQRKSLELIAARTRKKVNFKGFSSDLNKNLLNEYNGIIGVGRAVIEGLAMGYPVILAGNEKICGLIDEELYEVIKRENFTARAVNEKSVDEINEQLSDLYSNASKFIFRENIENEIKVNKIVSEYIEHLNNIPEQLQNACLLHMYDEMSKYDRNMRFHDNYNLLNLLNKYIYLYTNNIFIKNKIMILNEFKTAENRNEIMIKTLKADYANLEANFNELMTRHNELQKISCSNESLNKENSNKIEELANKSNNLEYQMRYLSKNINSGTIIKNNIRKLLNIIRRKRG